MNDLLNIVLALFVVAVIGAMTYLLSFSTLQAIDRLLWGISVHINDQSILTRRRDPITGKPTVKRPTTSQPGRDEGLRTLPWYQPGEEFTLEQPEVVP